MRLLKPRISTVAMGSWVTLQGVSQAKPSPAPPPPTTSPSAPEPTTTPAPTLQPRADSLESVDLELDSARTSAHKSVSPPAPSPSARRAAAAGARNKRLEPHPC